MRWQGRRQSGNLDDRRGMSKGKLAAGGGIVVTLIVLGLQFFGGETGQQLAPIVEQLGNSQTVQQTEQRELTAQEKEMGNLWLPFWPIQKMFGTRFLPKIILAIIKNPKWCYLQTL